MNPYEPTIIGASPPRSNTWVRLWNSLICIGLIGLVWLTSISVRSHYADFVMSGDLAIGYWGWFLGGVANEIFTLAIVAAFLLGLSTAPLHSHRRVTQIMTFVICAASTFNFQIFGFRGYLVPQLAITIIALFPMLFFGCGILRGYATAFRWFQANLRP